jgi:polyphosphate kinase
MTSERVLRFSVPSREILDRLASEPLPLGLEVGSRRLEFFRDLYLDTETGELQGRGISVRLRVRDDGSSTLRVDVREREDQDARVVQSHTESPATAQELPQLLDAPSEAATLVRALTDPTRLSTQLELAVKRRCRDAFTTSDPRHRIEIAYDEVTVRAGTITAEFQLMELCMPAQDLPELKGLVQAFEGGYQVRVTLADPLRRARELLEAREVEVLEDAIRAAREVAVIVYHAGSVALRRDGDRLVFPTGPGFGENACRRVLRAEFGDAQGQVRPLGTSPGMGARPALEVWLVERARREAGEADAGELVWLSLNQVLDEVGSPVFRDVRTLAALHAAARAGLSGRRGTTRVQPPLQPSAPPERAPVPVKAEAPPDTGTWKPADRVDVPEPGLPPEMLLNMELSALAFNARVLALASDPSVPLLERVRFLSIFGANLDEFFMTRVGGFKRQVAKQSTKKTLDGLFADEQLDVVAVRVRQMMDDAYQLLGEALLPELEVHGIRILHYSDLDPADREYLNDYYSTNIDAVLTPLAADPSHPFPHIRNLRPALAVTVRLPGSQAEHFAAIELPGDLPRFVPLPGGCRFVPLEEVIQASLPRLYAGMEVIDAHTFRVARSADFSLDEEGLSDVLQAVEEEVAKRPFRPVVRLEVESTMPEETRQLLLRQLQFEASDRVSTLSEEDVYEVDWLVDLHALREVASLPLADLHYPSLHHVAPVERGRSILEAMRERPILVRFPEDSFEATVERFLSEAADDDDVISVKITLYRTNRSSRIVRALRRARLRGKEVVALIELKASFDERRNIEWARSLETSGIHVIYGPSRLKVHAKIALVVRREGDGVRRYLYIGTGNLNAATAAAYTDLGLLTSDPELGDDLNNVFNSLTGYSGRTTYQQLLVAPVNMRRRFLELVEREADHARAGRGGHIRAKLNGLVDREIIEALYRASQAGTRIDLIVRGLCALRPGVPGVSENIRVISILGRFLEHSRIYHFVNNGDPEYYIGSADWRPRNLSKRVEVVTPIRDPDHRAQLDEILTGNLTNPSAWELQPDGTYIVRGDPAPAEGEPTLSSWSGGSAAKTA